MDKIEKLRKILSESKNIVFFTGAGASTESNIPDFRSVDGLYNQEYDYPPETILSATFFERNPKEFYRFYRNKMIYKDALPNKGHKFMADYQRLHPEKNITIITQNIDNLHQMAGSKNVIELHGTVYKNHCTHCGKFYSIDAITDSTDIPRCSCGGIIKPDVILYEEGLVEKDIRNAVNAIINADALIICGTSLTVYPAAGFIRYYQKDKLVIINKSTTSFDDSADLCIQDKIGEVLSQI